MDKFTETLLRAARSSFDDLFKEHHEHYYYLSLVMAECCTPVISAWSYEALERAGNDDIIKWSYADSPYCAYGYDKYFTEVSALFQETVNYDSDNFADRIEQWLSAMQEVMSILDKEGLFNKANKRDELFINAETAPPEDDDIIRAKALNPPDIFNRWYKEQGLDNQKTETDYMEMWHPELCDVIVAKQVTDRKLLIRIKELFGFEGTAAELLGSCKSSPFSPFVVRRDALLRDVQNIIKENNDLADIIEVRKCSRKTE